MPFRKNKLSFISLMTLFISVSCLQQENSPQPPTQVLTRYLEYSTQTDPGEFEYLYTNLPESIEDICVLIKKQLCHPFDIKQFEGKIPKDRVYEDRSIPNVEHMLKELLARDRRGLVSSRQPENRLIVACVHHSLLLASILRYKGIPVRLRAGNAKYIADDKRIRVSHAICEVWDERRNKWFLVDPDRHKIDFDRHEFEFACETWDRLNSTSIERKHYVSRYKSVDQATTHLVWLDLSYVTGAEDPYWRDPPIVQKTEQGIQNLSEPELQLLNRIATLLNQPDRHLNELIQIKEKNSSLNIGGEL